MLGGNPGSLLYGDVSVMYVNDRLTIFRMENDNIPLAEVLGTDKLSLIVGR